MTKTNKESIKIEFSTFEKFLIGLAIGLASLGLLALIVSIFLFLNGESFDRTSKVNSDKFADFGSFISGAVGAIWTLVSVFLFYITLRLQRKELALQREELELTRNELKGQKLELEKANNFSAIQQFDNKFFQLLGLQNEIKDGVYIDRSKGTYFDMEDKAGALFFQNLALLIAKRFYEDTYDEIFGSVQDEQKLKKIYQKAFHQYKVSLGHYFRNLFHIVRIVDENKTLSEAEKIDYIKILRAQLSQYEIVLLSYNGMTSYGESFYPLINKYELLKNIDFELLTPKDYIIKVVTPTILTNKYDHLKAVYNAQVKIFEADKALK